MDAAEFRKRGRDMVDYIADYLENLERRRPLAAVQPGYMRPLLPEEAPNTPDTWRQIMDDVERVIMPGVSYRYYNITHVFIVT